MVPSPEYDLDKIQSLHVRDATERLSINRLYWRVYVGGQTRERLELGIFGLNWCAIAHGFWGWIRHDLGWKSTRAC